MGFGEVLADMVKGLAILAGVAVAVIAVVAFFLGKGCA